MRWATVWLRSKHIPALNTCPKFELRFHGPFVITERIGSVAYRLALPPTYECHGVFHVSQLVPDRPHARELELQEAVMGWPPTRDVAGSRTDQYEVDCIMDQRESGDEAHYLLPPASRPVEVGVGKGVQEHPMWR
ncbi:hypothetical protein EPH_0048900 [Eimeria praecox]|uniref:Tf2-1-like SH3-like domain-containing protein n=1 Tax=Eimeria praecox TaxID=51316 RepID=U6GT53_9EIME|nr:hypothetical protein EPH_0048900 [Eimeria praecox]